MSRRRSRGRAVNGVVLLDKPQGITSNAALQKVKRLFNANKAGHTGSLDPLATGMLPICLGEATKMAAYLLDADKRYQVTIKLGATSTTGDSEGEIEPHGSVPAFTESELNKLLANFTGEILQIPPMHSALKRNGEPLYKLAHQGIEVEREARPVTIHEIKLLNVRDDELELDVHCSKGTYIRVLAEDIGQAAGCGGYVSQLRRTKVGCYDQPEKMLTLSQLEQLKDQHGVEQLDAVLLPVESALFTWPSIRVPSDVAFFLKRGQAVQVHQAPANGLVRIYKDEQQFIGVGQVKEDGKLHPKRLVNL